MKIELSIAKPRIVVDEYFEVSVRFVNDSALPISVPDLLNAENREPTYTIRGPSSPTGAVTSALAATMPGHKAPPQGTPVTTVDIPAGGSLQADMPLSAWLSMRQPGSHQLIVAIDHAGQRVQSAPLSIQVDPLAPRGLSVGADEGVPESVNLECAFIQDKDTNPSIYDLLIIENRPDLGEIDRHSLEFRRDLVAPVQAVSVPWSNGDRSEGLAAWRVWCSGEQLHADDSAENEPTSISMGAGGRLLEPAVQDNKETMDALVLGGGAKQVHVIRFEGGDPPHPPRGSLVWHSDPQGSIENARIALGARSSGNPRRVVTLERQAGQTLVSHFFVDGPSAPSATSEIKNSELLAGAPMAVRVTNDGITRCRFLVCTRGRKWRVYVVSLDFDEHGLLMKTGRIDPAVALEEPLPLAAIEFPLHDRDVDEVAWVLASHEGKIVWGRGANHPLEQQIVGALAVPLQVRALAFANYLAVLGPGRAPTLIPLGGVDVGSKRNLG